MAGQTNENYSQRTYALAGARAAGAFRFYILSFAITEAPREFNFTNGW